MNEVEAILVTTLVAAFIAVAGILTTRIIARRAATMDHIRRVASDHDLIQAREKFIELTEEEGGLAKYATKKPMEATEELKAIRTTLNDYEQMAIGIQFGVLDLEIIKRYMKSGIIRDWSHAAPFIYKVRQEIGSPVLYHEFEELARWLQETPMPKRRTWTRLWF